MDKDLKNIRLCLSLSEDGDSVVKDESTQTYYLEVMGGDPDLRLDFSRPLHLGLKSSPLDEADVWDEVPVLDWNGKSHMQPMPSGAAMQLKSFFPEWKISGEGYELIRESVVTELSRYFLLCLDPAEHKPHISPPLSSKDSLLAVAREHRAKDVGDEYGEKNYLFSVEIVDGTPVVKSVTDQDLSHVA